MILRLTFAFFVVLLVWPAIADSRSAMGGDWLGATPRNRVIDNERQFRAAASVTANAPAISIAAKSSLLADPLNATALRQLAYTADFKGTRIHLEPLQLADRVSRRDLITQVTLIEQEVAAGKSAQALRYYDRVLTVYPSSTQAMFAVLAHAANDQKLQRELAGYVKRPWFDAFLTVALKYGTNPDAVVELWKLSSVGQHGSDRLDLGRLLLHDLVAIGAYPAAGRMAAVQLPQGEQALGDPSFNKKYLDPNLGPFAWTFMTNDAVQILNSSDGSLEVEVGPGRSAIFAERVLMMPAGVFSGQLRLGALDSKAQPKLALEVRCLESGIAKVIYSHQAEPGTSILDVQIRIPTGCRAQIWRLTATGSIDEIQTALRIGWSSLAKR